MMRKKRALALVHAIRHSARNIPRGQFIEALEDRRLLSATLSTHGVLAIHGGGRADSINLTVDSQDSTELEVTVDGSMKQFFAANVRSIVVNGAGGNDDVSIGAQLSTPASVSGGAGNDTLVAGGRNDTLSGGAGNDSITCGSGSDSVNAGIGHDSVSFNSGAGASLDAEPENIQNGLTTLSQGATIGSVQAFADNGQIYYGTNVNISGQPTRIVVDSSGNPVGDAPPGRGKTGSQDSGDDDDDEQNAGVLGSVVSVDTSADTITISASNPWGAARQTTFTLSASTTISADGATKTLANLTAGTLVCVQVTSSSATTAGSIVAIDKRVFGSVSAIDMTADTIAITGPDGTSKTYSIGASTTVTLAGSASTLSQITTGAKVQLTLGALNGTVISIQSDPQANPPSGGAPAPTAPAGIGGSLVSVNTSANTITIQNGDGEQTTFTLASGATVTLDGTSSVLASLVAGDFVELTLTSGATTVASIEASDQGKPAPNPGKPGNPPPPTGTFGLVVSVDTTADTITIQAAGAASSTTYALTGAATVTLDGTSSTLSALVAGDTAGLQFASDGTSIASVNASDQGQPKGPGTNPPPPTNPGGTGGNDDDDSPYGVVAAVNTSADTITITDESGDSATYTLGSSATVALDGKSNTLSAIVTGDHAKLALASDDKIVTSIQATDQVPPPPPMGNRPGPGGHGSSSAS